MIEMKPSTNGSINRSVPCIIIPLEKDPLPDSLSALIRLAVDCMNGLEREIYKPYRAGCYHCFDDGISSVDLFCHVSLAGAVVAGRLWTQVQTGPLGVLHPYDFDPHTERRLNLLMDVASEDFPEALRRVGLDPDHRCVVDSFHHLKREGRLLKPDAFKFEGWAMWDNVAPTLITLANFLEEEGL